MFSGKTQVLDCKIQLGSKETKPIKTIAKEEFSDLKKQQENFKLQRQSFQTGLRSRHSKKIKKPITMSKLRLNKITKS